MQAEELVRRRLEVTPDDQRLWCTLGDLTLQDRYYLEAWERSGHRSARCSSGCGGRGGGYCLVLLSGGMGPVGALQRHVRY